MKTSNFKLAAILTITAAAASLVACGGDPAPQVLGAAAGSTNTNAVNNTAASALVGTAFSFPNGISTLGATGPSTLTLTSPTTYSLATAAGTVSGVISYGSCTFTQTAPVALPPVPFVPCNIVAAVGGFPADNISRPVGVILDLNGTVKSASVPLPTTISPTGEVAIKGTALPIKVITLVPTA